MLPQTLQELKLLELLKINTKPKYKFPSFTLKIAFSLPIE
jgi:hypothetical protein